MRVLVSGIASDIGFNCGRILQETEGVDLVFGVDLHNDHAGSCVFDSCGVAPPAAAAEYEDWLTDFLLRHKINVFLPTSEAEISRLSSGSFNLPSSVKMLKVSAEVANIALDKERCLSFVEQQGIAVPKHGVVGQTSPSVWPVIVKPRSGQGSKGISIAETAVDFDRVAGDGYIWQELLLPAEEEYTCAVYRSPAAGTRALILRRTLRGGLTDRGEVVADSEIESYVRSIADALAVNGAINIQLRMTSVGPRLFEINPRLSSTVMFRHRLGFKDLQWWLAEQTGEHVAGDFVPPQAGIRFYRGSSEYIIR